MFTWQFGQMWKDLKQGRHNTSSQLSQLKRMDITGKLPMINASHQGDWRVGGILGSLEAGECQLLIHMTKQMCKDLQFVECRESIQKVKEKEAQLFLTNNNGREQECEELRKQVSHLEKENHQLRGERETSADQHAKEVSELKEDISIRNERIKALESERGILRMELERHASNELKDRSLKAQKTIYESRRNREDLTELVKSREEIENLEIDAIRTMLLNPNEIKYDEAKKTLMEIDIKLEDILINDNLSNFKLKEKIIDEIIGEKEACEKLKLLLRETRELVLSEAKKRNVSAHQLENRGGLRDHEEPECFGNDGGMNIHEYLEQIESFLRHRKIPFSEGGEVLKRYLTGNPQKLVSQTFGLEINPDYKQLSEFLKENYGNAKLLFAEVKKLHEEIGRIKSSKRFRYLTENDIGRERDKVQEHLEQYRRVVKLRENEHNQLARYKVDVSDYKVCILRILSDDDGKSLISKKRDEDIMHEIKAILEDHQAYLFDIIQNSLYCIHEELKPVASSKEIKPHVFQTVTPMKSDTKNDSRITKKEIEVSECELCEHMYKINGAKPKNKIHGITRSTGTGKEITLIFTCPHIRDLDMGKKEEFLVNNRYCRSCLLNATGPNHIEEECKQAYKYKMQCIHTNCSKKYIICSAHKDLNEKKISSKQKELEDAGIHLEI